MVYKGNGQNEGRTFWRQFIQADILEIRNFGNIHICKMFLSFYTCPEKKNPKKVTRSFHSQSYLNLEIFSIVVSSVPREGPKKPQLYRYPNGANNFEGGLVSPGTFFGTSDNLARIPFPFLHSQEHGITETHVDFLWESLPFSVGHHVTLYIVNHSPV